MNRPAILNELRSLDPIIARIEKARALLAECRDAPEAKRIADLARAAEVYAKRQKLSEDVITSAHALKINALTLLGGLIKTMDKNKGAKGNPGGQGAKVVRLPNGTAQTPTLAELGISKRESSDAQALDTLQEQAPELHAQIEARQTTVSKARVVVKREAKRQELKAKAAERSERSAHGADEWTGWEIINTDCLLPGGLYSLSHGMAGDADAARGAAPHSPRLIFADPPYNIGVDYGDGPDADLLDPDEYLGWAGRWLDLCHDRLLRDGSLWLLINDEYAAEFKLAADQVGFTLRNWIVWYETFGVNCSDKFNRTKRHLLYFVKDPKRFVFHADAVSRPSDRQTKYHDARAHPDGKILDDVWFDIPRLPGTAAERIPDFPTQLPVALLTRVITCASDPGDLILDPFSGSGTTGEAAIRAGRRYIGLERNPKFAELARLRLKGVNCDPVG